MIAVAQLVIRLWARTARFSPDGRLAAVRKPGPLVRWAFERTNRPRPPREPEPESLAFRFR